MPRHTLSTASAPYRPGLSVGNRCFWQWCKLPSSYWSQTCWGFRLTNCNYCNYPHIDKDPNHSAQGSESVSLSAPQLRPSDRSRIQCPSPNEPNPPGLLRSGSPSIQWP